MNEAAVHRRVIYYHPDSGEIVSSWTFGHEDGVSPAGGEDATIAGHLEALRAEYGVDIQILDDDQTRKLSHLGYRVHVGTRKLHPHPDAPVIRT
jgi:hypothetical protein